MSEPIREATAAGAAVEIDVVVESPLWASLPNAESCVRRAATAALPAGCSGELCVLLTDDASIRDLNSRFRGRDTATNVLSFPAPRGTVAGTAVPAMLGDIVIAFETTRAEAESEEKVFSHHLSHLVVHGVLHLLGYDHETPAEADSMETQERVILATLAVPDPYAGREDA